ncbi:hypothetical protein ACFFX0_05750 [Citricoccus parietis]|uniref:Uncharacterized protein n=1 Tax=Citricoccus parietis TaxID=592307 RepID=A0ABV5FWS4_9MICC
MVRLAGLRPAGCEAGVRGPSGPARRLNLSALSAPALSLSPIGFSAALYPHGSLSARLALGQ